MALTRGAAEHVLTQQIVLAPSGAVHIRLLGAKFDRTLYGGMVINVFV
jgi:hypothetical protein